MSILDILMTAALFVVMMTIFTILGGLGAVAFHYIGDGIISLMYPVKKNGKW